MPDVDPDSAENRSEMQCPECWQQGLAPLPELTSRYDTERETIINATKCPHADCDMDRVPPEAVKKQLTTSSGSLFGFSFSIPKGVKNLSTRSLAIFLAMSFFLLTWVVVPALVGPILSGGSADSPEATGDVSLESPDSFDLQLQPDGAVITNGDAYVNSQGEAQSSEYEFDTVDEAQFFYAQLDDEYGFSASGYEVEETEDGVVITNGESYFDSNGGVTSEPFYFDSTDAAASTYAEVANEYGFDASGYQIVETDSGAEITDGYTYIDSNGDVTTDPVTYDSVSAAESTLGDFDSFSGDNPEFEFVSNEPDNSSNEDSLNETDDTTSEDHTATINGRVFDTESNPVSDADVEIPDADRSTTTDADGWYEITGLTQGEYTIWARTSTSTTPVDFAVTSEGEIRIEGDPEGALFATEANSEIVPDGQVSILATGTYYVNISGTGSNLQQDLAFTNPNNADDVTATLEPVRADAVAKPEYSTEGGDDDSQMTTTASYPTGMSENQILQLKSDPHQQQVTLSGVANSSTEIDVPGNRIPQNIQLELHSDRDEVPQNISELVTHEAANKTIPLSVDGDLPSDLTLRVNPQTETWTAAHAEYVNNSAGDQQVTFAGNVPPDQAAVNVTGEVEYSNTTEVSHSGTGSFNLSYDGNREAVAPTAADRGAKLTINGSTYTAATQTQSGTFSDGETISTEIDSDGVITGPGEETEPQLTVTGTEDVGDVIDRDLTGTGDINIDYSSNREAVGPSSKQNDPLLTVDGSVETGSSTQSSGTFSDGDTTPVTVDGSLAPSGPASGNPQLSITGVAEQGDRKQFTGSGVSSGSTTESLGGNIAPTNAQVTFTGQRANVGGGSQSISDGGTVDIDGNRPAQGTVEITGSTTQSSKTIDNSVSNNQVTHSLSPAAGSFQSGEITIDTVQSTSNSVSAEDGNVDRNGASIPISGNKINYITFGVPASSGTYQASLQYKDPSTDNWVDLGQITKDYSNGYIGRVKFKWELDDPIQMGDSNELEIKYSGYFEDKLTEGSRTGCGCSTYAYAKAGIDTTATVNGDTVSQGETVNLDGPSAVIQSDGGTVGYTIDYTVTSTTTSPVVTIGGKSVFVEGSFTGTKTRDITLSPGGNDVSISSFGPVSADITWNEYAVTEKPSIQINGQSVEPSSNTLSDGESETLSIPLESGSNTLDFSTATGEFDYTVAYTERWTTDGVSITTADSDESVSIGQIQPGETVTRELDILTAGTNDLQASVDRSRADYQLQYTPRYGARDITVTDGSGSTVLDHSGALDTTLTRRVALDSNDTLSVDAGAGGDNLDTTFEYRPRSVTGDVTVDVGGTGSTDATFDNLGPGDNETRSLDELTADTTTLQPTVEHGTADYELEYQPKDSLRDVEVTTGDGETVFSHDEKIPAGESVTGHIPLSGDTELSVDAAGTTDFETTVAFRERNETDNVEIDTTGDGEADIQTGAVDPGETRTYRTVVNHSVANVSGSGPYSYGLNYTATDRPQGVDIEVTNESETLTTETMAGPMTDPQTISVDDVAPGDVEIDTSVDRGAYRLNATWANQIGTRSPNVSIGSWDGCSIDGLFVGNETCYVPDGTLNASTNTVDFETEAGDIEYEFTMDARAVAEEVTVVGNDAEINYPIQMNRTGALPPVYTTDSSANVTAFEGGENTIQLQTEDVDGVETTATARVQYEGPTDWTKEPRIVVTNADGVTSERTITDQLNSDGELRDDVTVDLPREWFSEGTNSVRITTADGTKVHAEVEATGVESQVQSFE